MDALSLILLNLFINVLGYSLNTINPSVNLVPEGTNITYPLCVVDVVIPSTTAEGFQKWLGRVEQFCKSKKLKISCDKTNYMVCRKKARKETKNIFKINDKVLESVIKFTYLSVTIEARCKIE